MASPLLPGGAFSAPVTGEFWIKSTDNAPPLDAALTSGNPEDRDLSGAVVTLRLQQTISPYAVFEGVTEIVDPVACLVRYSWPTPFPLAPGVWAGEWRVVWSDGLTATYPNSTYFYMKILSAIPYLPGG